MQPTDHILTFTLNGKRYSFTRAQLERAIHNQSPRRIDKYQVSVGGVMYPPKQVVERLVGEEPINFTTMDAQRILKKFGFEVQTAPKGSAESIEGQTLSEQYFEYYLRSNGYFQFDFEPSLSGTTRKPDYRLSVEGEQVLLEVKEFLVSSQDFVGSPFGEGARGGAVDPYAPIRQKIDDAREKFRGLKNHVCCLVLYNVNKPLVDLNWQMIYGAMLGDITFRVPFDHEAQEFDDSLTTTGFGRNGKCRQDRNTTISAVLVLEPLMLGERRFQCQMNKLKRETGHSRLGWEAIFEARDKARGTERDPAIFQWRIVVHENPWANRKLSRNLFCGRFDERYGDQGEDGSIQRMFAGEGVLDLEALEQECPPIVPDFRKLPTV
ncbi:MAG: hypothetical protein JWQ42_3199 [Edaphobacter sp.]|nr:hypothetical protein [Edaphobacter sp.]